jgi:AcrR family transcriptional regulator
LNLDGIWMPRECQCGIIDLVARVTRETSKARTRQRLLDEAERLFKERGYAATSLEQIADAADVTKGAIYGHFSSKEDLLLSAFEAAPTPDFGTELSDLSRPLGDRLAELGRAMAAETATSDKAGLAVGLEFIAALLRSPEALRRYGAHFEHQLEDLAANDDEQPLPGTTRVQAWAIGYALGLGLQIYQCIAPEILTPAMFERAYELLAGLYPEPSDEMDQAIPRRGR